MAASAAGRGPGNTRLYDKRSIMTISYSQRKGHSDCGRVEAAGERRADLDS